MSEQSRAEVLAAQWAQKYNLPDAHKEYVKSDILNLLEMGNQHVIEQKLKVLENNVQRTKYLLHRHLGKGAFGNVYQGSRKSDKAIVAIKIIDLEDDHGDIMDVYREVIAMAANCAQLVKYLDSAVVDTKLWIVMEYLDGGSVQEQVKLRGHLSEAQIAVIARETLFALKYLWNEKKIHRDIKCANILLARTGRVKLADFGASRELTATSKQAKTMVGSPYWMAPDVIQGPDGYDIKADIWSLGITCLEMANGAPPHYGSPHVRVMMLIVNSPSPKLEGDQWSPEFKAFVASCLEKDPARRATIDSLLQSPFLRRAQPIDFLRQEFFQQAYDSESKQPR